MLEHTSGFSTFLAAAGAAAAAALAPATMPTSASSSEAFFCLWGFLENKFQFLLTMIYVDVHERRRKTEKRVGEEKKLGQRIGEVDPSLKKRVYRGPFS